MILRLIMGLAAMIFLWAVQAQAAEVTWQKDIQPIHQGEKLYRCAN